MQQQNSAVARLNYNTARDILTKAGMDPDKENTTQSFLRTETQLVIGKNSFAMPIQATINNSAGTIFNTEQRLQSADSFIVNSIGVHISKPASNIDATAIDHTYPNPLVFTVGLAALETIYRGFLKLEVGNQTIMPAWDLMRHRKTPQTQFTAGALMDQMDSLEDGYAPAEPNLVLVGNKAYILTLVLPAALATVEAFQRFSVTLRGILVPNSTVTA